MTKQQSRASSGRYVSRLTSGTLAVVMAGGRATIREMIQVSLPRPRDRSCDEFTRVREALLKEFGLNLR